MTVYLDHNATTPLEPRVLEAMLPFLREQHGNPSSRHAAGRQARAAVERAREQVAALVNAHPGQVVFTGGGTEANNLALKGAAAWLPRGRLAVSAVEHASVSAPAVALAARGWALSRLAVDAEGRLELAGLDAALAEGARLVSVMSANNEVGTLQELPAIGERVRAAGGLLHTDAVQAAGKIGVDFRASGAHLMSLSAHKLYGPKGVGALVADKAVELEPLLHGGGQERGLRGGTENVAGIVGFGAAAEIALNEMHETARSNQALRDELETLLEGLPGLRIFGRGAPRLPNTLFFAVAGIDGETLLMQLDRVGIELSSGSACASGKSGPSHVLTAMGVDRELARGALRVSLGRASRREDVHALADALRVQVERMRSRATVAAGR